MRPVIPHQKRQMIQLFKREAFSTSRENICSVTKNKHKHKQTNKCKFSNQSTLRSPWLCSITNFSCWTSVAFFSCYCTCFAQVHRGSISHSICAVEFGSVPLPLPGQITVQGTVLLPNQPISYSGPICAGDSFRNIGFQYLPFTCGTYIMLLSIESITKLSSLM